MDKLLPNALTFFIFLLVFVAYYYAALPIFHFPDLSWHLMNGDYIREHGVIPRVNPWTYTAADYDWFNISWGYDYFISLLKGNFGEEFLFYFMVFTGALSVTIIYSNCVARGVTVEASLITTALVTWGLVQILPVRPQLIAYVMIPIFHGILYSARGKDSKLVYILPLLMLLWVNLHGSFLVGFVIIGAFVVESFFSKQHKDLKKFISIGVLCVFAMFVNPWGPFVIEQVLRVMGGPMKDFISEWKGTSLSEAISWSVFITVFVLVTNVKNPNIPLSDKLLTYVWLIMGVITVRYFTLFIIFAAPYLAMCLHTLKPEQDEAFAAKIRHYHTRLQAMVLSLAFVIMFAFLSTNVLKRENDLLYPQENSVIDIRMIADFLVKHYPEIRFFNLYGDGGNLIYHSNGKLKVFIDGREITAYPEEVLHDYLAISQQKEGWEAHIDSYDIQGFILPTGTGYAEYIQRDGSWSAVWENPNYMVFVKKELVGERFLSTVPENQS